MTSCLHLSNVQFSYRPGNVILDIPELILNKGERAFIHGPSGSGKSTLLNLMAGVITADSGELLVLEQKLGELSVGQRDQFRGDHIGFVFQSFNLIPYLNIYENLSLPYRASKLRKSRVENLDSEIRALAEHLGLSEFLNQKVNALSIGQQQRVGVARALVGSPEIVIADEPTSSLDDDITDRFMELILEEQKRKEFTLIFVSHDKRLTKHFERNIDLREINKAGGGK